MLGKAAVARISTSSLACTPTAATKASEREVGVCNSTPSHNLWLACRSTIDNERPTAGVLSFAAVPSFLPAVYSGCATADPPKDVQTFDVEDQAVGSPFRDKIAGRLRGSLISLALLLLGFWPLLHHEACYVHAWQDDEYYRAAISPRDYVMGTYHMWVSAPLLGHYLAAFAAGIIITPSYFRGRHQKSDLAFWLQFYIWSSLGLSVSSFAVPCIFAACPSRTVKALYDAAQVAWYFTYTSCQICLASMTVIRLKLLRQDGLAVQCGRITIVCMAVGLITTVASLLIHRRDEQVVILILRATACVVYILCQLRVLVGLLQGAQMARQEARMQGKVHSEAYAAMFIALSLALSSGTTMLHMGLVAGRLLFFTSTWQAWVLEVFGLLDLFSDAVLALVCAGKFGLLPDEQRELQAAGGLVQAARERQVLNVLTEAARAVTGPSVTLAALFEGRSPEELLRAAVNRFRCISWDTLRQHPYLVTEGGALDGASVATDIYQLSEPCLLSGCDAFFSHSWRDNGECKWRALTAWCEAFSQAHGRSPRLWFDKTCIDQTNIEDDLQCLPIFLAGCNTLLVTCGTTYVSRLWCCVELFVYMKMSEGSDRDIQVCRLSSSPAEEQAIAEGWASFDVHKCQCFKGEDKRRILSCIAKSGGAAGFNDYIRSLSAGLFDAIQRRLSMDEVIVEMDEYESEYESL
eukprot:TRINITY_DN58304_c0_g1_i1.p1 TRINITY_DN58304_c0_g1~~TRINITY_DN58304_c0_g1_i1.p1  ORF type:complete len:692 (-),score=54.59 TRINITY_DN58304_c0_g1_i1:112-2187(-)